GWQQAKLADFEGALESCNSALRTQRELNDRQGMAASLDSLGYAQFHLDDYRAAIASYQESAELRHILGARYSRAETLVRLGDTFAMAGDPGAAAKAWGQALSILEALGHPDAEDVKARFS